MSPRLIFAALVASLLGSVAVAADTKPAAPHIVVNKAPPPPGPDPEMTTYYFGLITKGSNFDSYDQEDRARIQALHLRNIERLAKLGKLLVAGPFTDNGEWRGIFIFKCDTLEEARQLAATDPAVLSGRLRIEIHPWMTAKGYIRDPEFPTPK